MKKSILLLAVAVFSITLVSAQQEVTIDTSKSTVKWKGSHSFSFGSHYGTVKCKEGRIIKTNDKITGGTFTIDMTTIVNTDGDYSENLVEHLKNEDFFDVINHPTAKLVINNVKYLEDRIHLDIEADLTIKGITLPIGYQAKMDPENNDHISAKFIIDRTDWNIMYGSKGITKVKDYILSDAIEFEVLIITD